MDSVSLEVGSGNATTVAQLALQQSWDTGSTWLAEHHLHTYWEVSAAAIEERKYRNIEGRKQNLVDFGFTPVLRWHGFDNHGLFGEIGIGVNYFTENYDNNGRRFGGDFQFGDHVGVGCLFSKQLEVTLKLQHFSNADIKQPNPGFNAGMIKLAWMF